MTRAAAVAVTLVLYQIALLAIGLWSERRTRDGADFFLGGRRLGPVVAAVSASASSSSAWTLLGVSGFAYTVGVASLWLFPACVGGFALNWYLLAGPLRRTSREADALTVTELLAGPPGRPLRRVNAGLASLVVVVFLTAYVASQFQGAGKTFHETFGVPTVGSILIGAAVVVAYTLLGGFWAVSVTDTLQGLLMALTACVLPLTALVAVGGPAGLVRGLAGISQPGFLSPVRGLGPVVGAGFVAGLLGIGLGYPGQPHVVNRFMALRRGRRELVVARRVALGWAVVVYAGMILLGLCGRLLVPGLDDAEVVFVTLANELMSPVLAGIMVAAVLSAIMSTADSQLLVAASALTHDLGWGGAALLRRSRLVVVALSLLATLAALAGPREIFSPVLVAWAAMGAAFGPLLFVAARGRPAGPLRTLLAMSVGLVLAVGGAIHARAHGAPWDPIWERVVPVVVALGIAFAPGPARRAETEP